MKLLIGLGNPGIKYQNNRHNVGHMFIDYLKKKNCTKNFQLIKTKVFMNNSGQEIVRLISTRLNKSLSISMNLDKSQLSNGLPISNVFVIHDDLDIKLGNFKIQKGTGPKVHNGLASIEDALGTKDFWRVRIGIDNRNPEHKGSGETYVLSDFQKEELEILQKTFSEIYLRLSSVCK